MLNAALEESVCRAGASGPAGPVLAGPIFRRLRGVSTPCFYNTAMRIVDWCARVGLGRQYCDRTEEGMDQRKQKSGLLEAPEY